ncbi:hypothetical protein [Methanobrevibacter sp. TMH8]|uniref:hypothetical protein n=1 Tax=Methanobrevibacter sp. TMH8 TaxID=2848611 RepID=UPI001CCB8FFF|nr:hypothetical protein [Methanobrevibacter sp. TMH8]
MILKIFKDSISYTLKNKKKLLKTKPTWNLFFPNNPTNSHPQIFIQNIPNRNKQNDIIWRRAHT